MTDVLPSRTSLNSHVCATTYRQPEGVVLSICRASAGATSCRRCSSCTATQTSAHQYPMLSNLLRL